MFSFIFYNSIDLPCMYNIMIIIDLFLTYTLWNVQNGMYIHRKCYFIDK